MCYRCRLTLEMHVDCRRYAQVLKPHCPLLNGGYGALSPKGQTRKCVFWSSRGLEPSGICRPRGRCRRFLFLLESRNKVHAASKQGDLCVRIGVRIIGESDRQSIQQPLARGGLGLDGQDVTDFDEFAYGSYGVGGYGDESAALNVGGLDAVRGGDIGRCVPNTVWSVSGELKRGSCSSGEDREVLE